MKRNLLTTKQKRAIDLLVKGWNTSEVSRLLKIDKVTLWRWKQQKAFKELLAQKNQDEHQTIQEKLATLLDKSKDILMDALDKKVVKIPGFVRIALDILKTYKPALELIPNVQQTNQKLTPEQKSAYVSAYLEEIISNNSHPLNSQEFEQMLADDSDAEEKQTDIEYQI